MNSKIIIMFAASLILINGCATRSTYVDSINEFSAATTNASNVITEETKASRDIRRKLGLVYFLQNPDELNELNIDPLNTVVSFGRFVCTGYGLYEKKLAEAAVLKEYGIVLNTLAEEPKAKMSIISRMSLIQDLLKEQPELVLKEINENIFRTCMDEVVDLVPPAGKTIIPSPDEFAMTALVAIPAIYKAAEAALDKAGAIMESTARAAAIKEYVKENGQSVSNILDDSFADDWLVEANRMRKESALSIPYQRFVVMLELPRTSSRQKLNFLSEGDKVISELKVYDQLQTSNSFGKAVRTMRKAQEKLQALSKGDLESKETWKIFKEYAKEMADLVKVVNESQKQLAETLKKS